MSNEVLLPMPRGCPSGAARRECKQTRTSNKIDIIMGVLNWRDLDWSRTNTQIAVTAQIYLELSTGYIYSISTLNRLTLRNHSGRTSKVDM